MLATFNVILTTMVIVGSTLSSSTSNKTHYNPAIPGWHSDPSCVFVAERDNTTFCTSSTFLLIPGLPIHASKDLSSWKLVSHAVSRKSQYPEYDQSLAQIDGIWAATIRYYQGTFYIITIYRKATVDARINQGLIFKTTDPYSDQAWSDPIRYDAEFIDPDLFWDDDGTAYVATAGTYLQTVDLETGVFSEARRISNGTSGEFLEGPHLYKKDGIYYLLVAEGGSGINHTVTIARSKDIWGPYENYDGNPILSNKDTTEYFQNVGHADLFQDARGRWWATALSWRSGPEANNYPMGRETVMTPVTWKNGCWPVISPVRGIQSGWYLPSSRNLPGDGRFVDEADVIDFEPNSTIPRHFGFWRWPDTTAYALSPPGHPNTLRLTPSVGSIIAGFENYTAGYDIENFTLTMRLQTDTVFQYSVDMSYAPQVAGEEAGVTVFLNQVQNINLGITLLWENVSGSSGSSNSSLTLHLRFLVSGLGSHQDNIPAPSNMPVPRTWLQDPIRLIIRAVNETHYVLSAASCLYPSEEFIVGTAPATIVSGGDGPFTGSLVGVYATKNGGNGTTPAYVSRWRYQGLAQSIDNGQLVPSRFSHPDLNSLNLEYLG
ncbi:glycosyl hydrolase [Pyrenochaeta sp. MPI-SDFR-AT-0127]|nr:glycosyl hydrolase [Pyrenochaeta sp. MPI-SDFR-AT-0127]